VSFSSVVLDIREEGRVSGRQRWQLLLSETEFTAGDTGRLEAVARSGTRLSVPVLGTVEEGEDVWLQVEKPLMAGTEVMGWVERRAEGQLREGQLPDTLWKSS
jgi:hypothetical protein